MVSEEDVLEALGSVEDPELPVSIVDMGLIYGVEVDPREQGARVTVEMTFTSMGCPAMGMLKSDVHEALEPLDDVEEVRIRTVWDPPWTTDRLSEEARDMLRVTGVSV